jgi:hypothetical protein
VPLRAGPCVTARHGLLKACGDLLGIKPKHLRQARERHAGLVAGLTLAGHAPYRKQYRKDKLSGHHQALIAAFWHDNSIPSPYRQDYLKPTPPAGGQQALTERRIATQRYRDLLLLFRQEHPSVPASYKTFVKYKPPEVIPFNVSEGAWNNLHAASAACT